MPIVLSRKGGLGGTAGTAQALSIGVSTGGNTAGNTKVSTGSRFVIVGSNGITASQGTAVGATTVTLSGAGAPLSVGVSTGGNTSGDTTVNTGSRFVLAGGNGITLSQGTAAGATTVTISAGAAADAYLSHFPMVPVSTGTVVTAGSFQTGAGTTSATANIWPVALAAPISINRVFLPILVSMTSATTNSNWSWTLGQSFGLYTQTGASLSLLSSFSNDQRLSYTSAANSTNATASWVASYGAGTNVSSNTSISTNNAGATGFWSSISSLKNHPFASGGFSLSKGQYFGVWAWSSTSGGANLASLSAIGVNTAVAQAAVAMVQELGLNVNSTTGPLPLIGRFELTQTNTALPASFLTAVITTAAGNATHLNRSVAVVMMSQ